MVILIRSLFTDNGVIIIRYDRADASESIEIINTSVSKKCINFHYLYFLDNGFRFESSVCNVCHDVLMMSIDIGSMVPLNVSGIGYCFIIVGISKSEAINLLKHIDFIIKSNTRSLNIFKKPNAMVNFG